MRRRLRETGFTPRAILRVTLIAVNITLIASYVASLLLGLYLFFFTPEGSQLSQESLRSLQLYLIFWRSVPVPGPLNIGGVISSLLMVYGLCFGIAWVGSAEPFVPAMKKACSQSPKSLIRNFLAAMPIISAASLLLTLSIVAIQDWVGVETGEIIFVDPYVALLSLAYAPITEEIGFRLIPLGTTAALSLLWRTRNREASRRELLKAIPLSILHPSAAKRRLGVGGIGKAEWTMLLTSSLAFGLSHIMGSVGWEAGKVTSSTLVGMIFGLSHLHYGIHAPLLIHWFFNYYLYIGEGFYPAYGATNLLLHLLLIALAILLWPAEEARWPSIIRHLKGHPKNVETPKETPPKQQNPEEPRGENP